jgi:hypothetical protein
MADSTTLRDCTPRVGNAVSAAPLIFFLIRRSIKSARPFFQGTDLNLNPCFRLDSRYIPGIIFCAHPTACAMQLAFGISEIISQASTR